MIDKLYFFEDLLPYKVNCNLPDLKVKVRVLSLTCFIIEKTIDALTSFYINKNFIMFDPHVGENLCQIRACQILDLFEEYIENEKAIKNNIETELKTLKDKKDAITKFLNLNPSQYDKVNTLSDLMSMTGMKFKLSWRAYYLFLCYFLTIFRIFNLEENTVINYRSMVNEIGVSKNLARKIIHEYQKKLSEESCNYVERILGDAGVEEFKINLFRMVDDDARHTLPCYLTMKILLKKLMQLKSTVLFVVRSCSGGVKSNIYFSYLYSDITKKYEFHLKPIDHNRNLHAFIVHGVTASPLDSIGAIKKYLNQVRSIGLENLIMANMATHPQYSGNNLNALKYNPFIALSNNRGSFEDYQYTQLQNEFMAMKRYSEDVGCSEFQPKLFFIRHISVDYERNQMQRVIDRLFYSDFSGIQPETDIYCTPR